MDQLIKLLEKGDCESLICQDQEDFFNQINEEFLAKKYVKDSFLKAIKKRESEFPTGLIAGNYKIAINHVDAEHVNTNALFIYSFKNPVQYRRMDNPEEKLDVQIVSIKKIETLCYQEFGLASHFSEIGITDQHFDEIASRLTNNGQRYFEGYHQLSKQDIVDILNACL